MKKLYMIIILLICFLGSLLWWIEQKSVSSFDASVTIACIGQEYVEEADGFYLKFLMADEEISKCLRMSKDLQNKISMIQPEEIIGIHLLVHIPAEVIRKNHFDNKSLDAIWLLMNSTLYDDYYEIVDVSVG